MFVGIRATDAVTNGIDTAGNSIDRARRGQRILAIGALGILLLVGGCTKVGPDFVKPDAPIAEQWTETGELQLIPTENDHEDWWEAFKDPVLNKLVNEAYNQNLTLQIAGLRIVEARAQLGIAVGTLYPQQQDINGSANYTSRSENARRRARVSFPRAP